MSSLFHTPLYGKHVFSSLTHTVVFRTTTVQFTACVECLWYFSVFQNQGMVQSFSLVKTSKIIDFNPTLENLPLTYIYTSFKHLQQWGPHTPLGTLFKCLKRLFVTIFFPNIQTNLSRSNLSPFPLFLLLATWEKIEPHPATTSFHVIVESVKETSLPSISFSPDSKNASPSATCALDSIGPLWICFSTTMSFLIWGAQNTT